MTLQEWLDAMPPPVNPFEPDMRLRNILNDWELTSSGARFFVELIRYKACYDSQNRLAPIWRKDVLAVLGGAQDLDHLIDLATKIIAANESFSPSLGFTASDLLPGVSPQDAVDLLRVDMNCNVEIIIDTPDNLCLPFTDEGFDHYLAIAPLPDQFIFDDGDCDDCADAMQVFRSFRGMGRLAMWHAYITFLNDAGEGIDSHRVNVGLIRRTNGSLYCQMAEPQTRSRVPRDYALKGTHNIIYHCKF